MYGSIAPLYLGVFLPGALGFVGMGLDMYNPVCAFACQRAIQYASLSCSATYTEQGIPSPECRANDRAYLTTLAWCMDERCTPWSVETWQLEKFWREEATGDQSLPPKWGYIETLQHIATAPDLEWEWGQRLVVTATVPADRWETQRRSMENSRQEEALHARYG